MGGVEPNKVTALGFMKNSLMCLGLLTWSEQYGPQVEKSNLREQIKGIMIGIS